MHRGDGSTFNFKRKKGNHMELIIKCIDLENSKAIRKFVRRQVASKLARVFESVSSVRVSIRDVNGPRGGKDHRIQLLIRLKPSGNIVLEHQDFDAYRGVVIAIERGCHALKRNLGRRRNSRIDASRRSTAVLASS